MYDLVIIGSGPAGLSAALAAGRSGLDYVVLERGVIAETVYRFPLAKKLFSTGNELELTPGYFPQGSKPTREELLLHYVKTARDEGLRILTGVDVLHVDPAGDSFSVRARDHQFASSAVLVAVGGFGRQRKLWVQGEEEHRVSYRFQDPFLYAMKRILVVGGGNSAVEAALDLAEVATDVTLSVRRASLDLPPTTPGGASIKPWVLAQLDVAVREGKINLLCSSRILEITPDSAVLAIGEGAADRVVDDEVVKEIRCDHIVALIGADPDTRLLEDAGAAIAGDGRPVYDPQTCETTVPGLFVAGHLTRERHIKKAIKGAAQVIETAILAALARCSV
jgi:thioredoxin reductase (NADPH)